ncbi:hypothetical protein BGW39_004678 [Mortierella sp. 14UC]|nr:hypothetical protein BGW39_004678 [Mortierella sp. 14UC]
MPTPPPQPQKSPFISPFDIDSSSAKATTATTNTTPAASNITSGSSRPLIRPILNEGHHLVDSADFGSGAYEDEKNDVRLSTSVIPRRDGGRSSRNSNPNSNNNDTGKSNGNGNSHNSRVVRQGSDNTTLRGGGGGGGGLDPPDSSANSTISPDSTLGPPIDINQPRPRLEQVGPHIATATIQAYNILTVVRSVADPTWMVLKTSSDKSGGKDNGDHMGRIGKFETIFLGLAVVCSLLSCVGFTLRIMDRMTWIRRAPVLTSYLQRYGNVSPQTIAGRVIFFFYAVIGISAVGYFIVALRNAVLEQFQWRLLERFSKPAHITRVQTRMSTKDMSFPLARFEEEQRVKKMVKRNMIFVTLTTVGFGDMVPTEPGSIEFWNIYVFLGLTVFAYILSLFSDTMASQIHLVDDGEGEDEDEGMYGWEQCEDPNHQFSAWKGGAALGLEGVKWAQQQESFKVDQGLELGQGEEFTADGWSNGWSNVPQPGQQTQPDRPRGLQRGVRFWNGSGVGLGVGPLDSRPASQHPLDGLDPQQPYQQPQNQQMSQMSQQRPRYIAQRRNSAGRILMIPGKERKQMLEAEYYATHGGPPVDTITSAIKSGPAATGAVRTATTVTMAGTGRTGGGEMMVMTTPATTKFVDKYGIPHQRVIGRRMSYIPGGIQAHLQTGYGDGMESGTTAGTSAGHPLDGVLAQRQQQQQQQQGHTFSTTGYSNALVKRRGTLVAVHQQRQEYHGQRSHYDASDQVYGHDGGQGRPTTPMQDQYQHQYQHQYHHGDTTQTGALEHQPTVRFESPHTRSGNGSGSGSGNGGSAAASTTGIVAMATTKSESEPVFGSTVDQSVRH